VGFRFQRHIRILPGLRINLSKSGVSASVGGHGAWLTVGPRGSRATVGLPGTGLSYTQQVAAHRGSGDVEMMPLTGDSHLPTIDRSRPDVYQPLYIQPAPVTERKDVFVDSSTSQRAIVVGLLVVIALLVTAVALH
jgi:hypothetical protein